MDRWLEGNESQKQIMAIKCSKTALNKAKNRVLGSIVRRRFLPLIPVVQVQVKPATGNRKNGYYGWLILRVGQGPMAVILDSLYRGIP